MEEAQGRWRPRGLHSDDGQQALALCDALLDNPDEPEVGFAELLVELLRAGAGLKGTFGLHRGTGRNFRKTVLALKDGAGPFVGGQPSAGNGVAMMITPVALYWRRGGTFLRDMVLRVARVKSTDLRSIAAAGAIAYLVVDALDCEQPRELNVEDMVRFVLDLEIKAAKVTGFGDPVHIFSEALARMLIIRDQPREEVLEQIARTANETASRHCFSTTGYAVASVVTSIYLVLSSVSLEQALVDTVNLGGDADTTGAMVGAVCGALYGHEAIPKQWLGALLARGCFEDRVDALLHRQRSFQPEVPLVDLERKWTALLVAGPSHDRLKLD